MRLEQIGSANLYNGDCMEYMAGLPDKAFELAIVDPPYGLGDFIPKYGKQVSKIGAMEVKWNNKTPENEYFNELIRVSANQIIWGANYYNCFPGDGGAIVWYKHQTNPRMSQAEIASCSLQKKVSLVDIPNGYGFLRDPETIHPCQKPIALYKWLLSRYAKTGDRVLDTHGGSGSSVIACLDMGFPIVWVEKDEDYYNAALNRIKIFNAQGKLFEEPKKEAESVDMFAPLANSGDVL